MDDRRAAELAVLNAAIRLVEHGFVAEYFDGPNYDYNAERCGACDQLIDAGGHHTADCPGVALESAVRRYATLATPGDSEASE